MPPTDLSHGRGGDGHDPPFRRIPPRPEARLTGGHGVTLDLSGVDPDRIPRHVGLILDGNGRWANARGLPRTAGHAAGEAALFDTVEGALEIGIGWLTAYTFSTENWSGSAEEVEFLMWFNEDLLTRRRDDLHEKGVRMRFAGDIDDPRIPDRNRKHMAEAADSPPATPASTWYSPSTTGAVARSSTPREPRLQGGQRGVWLSMTSTRRRWPTPVPARHARCRPDHSIVGRAPALQLSPVAGGICRVLFPGNPLARLQPACTCWMR